MVVLKPGDVCVLARNRSGFNDKYLGRALVVMREYHNQGDTLSHAVVKFLDDKGKCPERV